MDDKDIKTIAYQIRNDVIKADEAHEWLASASVDKLKEYLRWMPIGSPWSQHGRDALNIVLAKENIQLQKDIRDLTAKLHKLTIVLAIIGLITLYPIVKPFFNSFKTESAINQNTNTTQLQDSKNDTLNKTKTINHK